MKNLKYVLIFIPLFYSCKAHQVHIVDKISNEVCVELNKIENVDGLNEDEVKLIIGKVFIANKPEWDSELDKVENSRNNGHNIFDELLKHKLLLTCDKYRIISPLLDKSLIKNPKKRALYLKAKDFIILTELGKEINDLVLFFDKSKHTIEDRKHLKSLQKELLKAKNNSGIYIMWSENRESGLVFNINIFDYITGDEKVFVKILFKNKNDNLIDEIIFKNKNEIEKGRKKRESEDIDFISPLPPPPPPKK